MTSFKLSFVHPNSIDRKTGGSKYDRRLLDCLVELGTEVDLVEVIGSFPEIKDSWLLDRELKQVILIDGLAIGLLQTVSPSFFNDHIVVVVYHNPLHQGQVFTPEITKRLYQMDQLILPLVQGIICTSEFSRRYLMDEFGLDGIMVAEPGRPDCFQQEMASVNDQFTVMTVGSISELKNQKFVLEVLEGIETELSILLVGELSEGMYMNELKKFADRSHHSICIAGTVENICDLLCQADLLVHLPQYESYGMILTEAMACGLPIVASRVGGIPDTLQDGGVLVELDQPDHITEKITALVNDPKQLDMIKDQSRTRYNQLPTWSETANKVFDFLVSLQELSK